MECYVFYVLCSGVYLFVTHYGQQWLKLRTKKKCKWWQGPHCALGLNKVEGCFYTKTKPLADVIKIILASV